MSGGTGSAAGKAQKELAGKGTRSSVLEKSGSPAKAPKPETKMSTPPMTTRRVAAKDGPSPTPVEKVPIHTLQYPQIKTPLWLLVQTSTLLGDTFL